MSDRAWLLAYDVRDRKRLGHVHRCARKHAMAIEYSVFWLEGSPADKLRCIGALLPLIDKREDDLRLYAMPGRGLKLRLGQAVLPQGITWSALPAGFQWGEEMAHTPPSLPAGGLLLI